MLDLLVNMGVGFSIAVQGRFTMAYTQEELVHLARTLSKKEWDKRFPPKDYGTLEPSDATGWTDEVTVEVYELRS